MTGRGPVVAITRDERRDPSLSRALEALGARPMALQTMAVEPVNDRSRLQEALRARSAYAWIVFTSVHAVEVTCRELGAEAGPDQGPDGAFGPARVAAVGSRTAARLLEHGIAADLVPPDGTAAALATALERAGDVTGRRVLWPCGNIARPDLRVALERAGAVVTPVEVYRTFPVRPANLEAFLTELRAGRVDAVLFLSPSSARSLAAALPEGALSLLNERAVVGSIGPTTTETLVQLGLRPHVEAEERSAEGLARAIVLAAQARGVAL